MPAVIGFKMSSLPVNRIWEAANIISAKEYCPVETFAVPILDNQGNIRAILEAGISLTQLSNALVNIGYNANTQALAD